MSLFELLIYALNKNMNGYKLYWTWGVPMNCVKWDGWLFCWRVINEVNVGYDVAKTLVYWNGYSLDSILSLKLNYVFMLESNAIIMDGIVNFRNGYIGICEDFVAFVIFNMFLIGNDCIVKW